MLTERIITNILSRNDSLVFANRSRCVRMRFNRNTCSRCIAICAAAAISLDNGIMINGEKCTGCMLCVSECPSDCLSAAGEDFTVLLAKLRKTEKSVPACVLGCKTVRNGSAHVKTCCLGVLSEEHLIALMGHLHKPLYLDLSECGTCRNSSTREKLRMRLESIRTKAAIDFGNKILLTEQKENLIVEDVSLDRRGFFQALKNMTFTQAAELLDDKHENIPVAYSEKRAPLKRQLLGAAVKNLSETKVTAILNSYAFTLEAGPSCTACSACVGMCPSGALKVKKDADGAALLFNSSLCSGCALCKDFCPEQAVSVIRGYTGKNFFEDGACQSGALTARNASSNN